MHNTLIQGDCTSVLQSLPGESIDAVITDPPYFVRYRDRSGRSIANDDNPASVLGAFTDLETVRRLEAQMEREGHLAASAMAGTFDILRANDLIFSYVDRKSVV